ncbi:hypothetical protein ACHAW5_011153 [Stephanodiscus triporus]|uniref:Amidohydrolase-related domain-containing protein n=1 Tax=Stephanodiscus triporus TaxID=2934178 RepID=A0ABD3QVI9_9STRA
MPALSLAEVFLVVSSIGGVQSWMQFKSLPLKFSGGRRCGGSMKARELICSVDHNERLDYEILAKELEHCEGEIIDPHLHSAPWFDDADTLLEELRRSNVSVGLLYDPYPKLVYPYDVNTRVATIAKQSNGRIYALASLNTTHDNWTDHREYEIKRLRDGLKRECVLGTKLAPPQTCLPLNGPIMDDILEVVNESIQKLVAIHIGTTPACGPLGKQIGIECNCDEECVDPSLLIPKIEAYPDVTFVLLHSGHEFMPAEGQNGYYYDFRFTDKCIAMARKYDNVYLSVSAIFAQHPDGTLKYPGGFETVRKMKEAGITRKVFWGSDASFYRGQIRPVLLTAIKAMIVAGWTPEERAWTLRGCARHVFKIPLILGATIE